MKVQIRLVNEGDRLNSLSVPIDSSTVVVAGDVIGVSAGKAIVCADANDCDKFIGVSLHDSPNGSTKNITVVKECIAKAPAANDTYVIGDALALNATGTALEKSANNTICHVVEGVTGTSVKVLFDSVNLGKFFKINATA